MSKKIKTDQSSDSIDYRLLEILEKTELLGRKKVSLLEEIGEENFYNKDRIHLSLLKRLKEVDDEIQRIQSEENSIMENGKTDVIRNYKMMLDAIKKTDKWEEQRPIPPELWKELLYSGK